MENLWKTTLKRLWFVITFFISIFALSVYFLYLNQRSYVSNSDYFLFKTRDNINKSTFFDKNSIYFCLYKLDQIVYKLDNDLKLSDDDLKFLHRDINRFSTVKIIFLIYLYRTKKLDDVNLTTGEMRLLYSPWDDILLFVDKIGPSLLGESKYVIDNNEGDFDLHAEQDLNLPPLPSEGSALSE